MSAFWSRLFPGSIRCQVDAPQLGLLEDETRLEALGLDPDRGGKHVLVSLPQQRDVVDSVQERDDDRLADALGRRELQSRRELCRFWRHPQDVDLPVERRLLRRLSELSQLYQGGAHGVVDIPLTQEELAELAGTSRATVNAVLGDAQTRGLVELRRGKVRIVDLAGLVAQAGR